MNMLECKYITNKIYFHLRTQFQTLPSLGQKDSQGNSFISHGHKDTMGPLNIKHHFTKLGIPMI